MELSIREVRPQDAEGIIRILNPIIEAGRFTVLEGPLTAEEEREFIANFPARGVFQVAERRQDGRIVGFLSLEPFATYTHVFDHVATMGTYVDLSLRRRGIGKSLASASFELAEGRGFEKVFTYIRARNPEALAFYRALGFRIVGTAQRQVRIDEQYEDEIIVEKLLSQ
jgi:L-amino acid N-acyltransferase YncA